MDLPVTSYAQPGGGGGCLVRIWGVPIDYIWQARRLGAGPTNSQGALIRVSGGMGRGLPLAKPAQAGLLIQGMIWQSFANWIGTAMTLEFNVVPGSFGTGTLEKPVNLSFAWKAGTPLSGAIDATLAAAYPKYTRQIRIGANLVADHDEVGHYGTLDGFAQVINRLSKAVVSSQKYGGVQITLQSDTLFVTDNAQSPASPTEIDFLDMIGQPTWVQLSLVQVTLVMRGDLNVGDFVKFPTSIPFVTADSQAALKQRSTFSGTFQISGMRHVGQSRSPDGQNWMTVLDCTGPVDPEGQAAL